MKPALIALAFFFVGKVNAELPPELSSEVNAGSPAPDTRWQEALRKGPFLETNIRLDAFPFSNEENAQMSLPKMIITAKPIRLAEESLLTDDGRLKLAEKRYITPLYRITFGPLSQLATYYWNPLSLLAGWHPNEREAMALYEQDVRLERVDEMESLLRLQSIDRSGDSRGLRKVSRDLQQVRYNFLLSR